MSKFTIRRVPRSQWEELIDGAHNQWCANSYLAFGGKVMDGLRSCQRTGVYGLSLPHNKGKCSQPSLHYPASTGSLCFDVSKGRFTNETHGI